jgi:serine/threonine protein kinase
LIDEAQMHLDVLIHEFIGFRHCASMLAEALKAKPDLADVEDTQGRRAIDAACKECKEAMEKAVLFVGRYRLAEGQPEHKSRTCVVIFAEEVHAEPEKRHVALKFMRDIEQFNREVRMRNVENYDGRTKKLKRVIEKVRAHEDDEFMKAVEELRERDERLAKKKPQESYGKEQSQGAKDKRSGAAVSDRFEKGEYRCLVMPRADRSLKAAIYHEHFAGKDWPKIRMIGTHLVCGLQELHDAEMIHGDFKPLNACRVEGVWKLIDLDCAGRFKESFGNKQPSSGYSPPEMAQTLLKAGWTPNWQPQKGDTSKLGEYRVDKAYDYWSFGVVLYHLCFGKSMWHTDQNDDVTSEKQLKTIADWDDEICRKMLRQGQEGFNDSPEFKYARDLLRKLLAKNPGDRVAAFPDIKDVLKHPFFRGETLDAKAVKDQLDHISQRQEDQTQILLAQFPPDMLCPRLVFFVPESGSGTKAGSEIGWLDFLTQPSPEAVMEKVLGTNTFRLFLCCEADDCKSKKNLHKGIKVELTGELLGDMMPMIASARKSLKFALNAIRKAKSANKGLAVGSFALFFVPGLAWLGSLFQNAQCSLEQLEARLGTLDSELKDLEKKGRSGPFRARDSQDSKDRVEGKEAEALDVLLREKNFGRWWKDPLGHGFLDDDGPFLFRCEKGGELTWKCAGCAKRTPDTTRIVPRVRGAKEDSELGKDPREKGKSRGGARKFADFFSVCFVWLLSKNCAKISACGFP